MEFLYWFLILLFFLMLFIGLKDGLGAFIAIWSSYGFKFAISTAVLFLLFIAPSIVKSYAPEYYGVSIWLLLGYIAFLLILRLTSAKNDDEKMEG